MFVSLRVSIAELQDKWVWSKIADNVALSPIGLVILTKVIVTTFYHYGVNPNLSCYKAKISVTYKANYSCIYNHISVMPTLP